MLRYVIAGGLVMTGLLAAGGCPQVSTSQDASVETVQNAADQITSQIGVAGGYGGTMMSGYMQNMPMHMGFTDPTKLAEPGATMTVKLHNQTDQQATFHLMYMSSPQGLTMQIKDVTVDASADQDVELPCSEMVGAGVLSEPGSVGCVMANGQTVGNLMAVPGFLGVDYECGGTFEFFLQTDTQDLDRDGNTADLILISSSLNKWADGMMGSGGMMGGGTQP